MGKSGTSNTSNLATFLNIQTSLLEKEKIVLLSFFSTVRGCAQMLM